MNTFEEKVRANFDAHVATLATIHNAPIREFDKSDNPKDVHASALLRMEYDMLMYGVMPVAISGDFWQVMSYIVGVKSIEELTLAFLIQNRSRMETLLKGGYQLVCDTICNLDTPTGTLLVVMAAMLRKNIFVYKASTIDRTKPNYGEKPKFFVYKHSPEPFTTENTIFLFFSKNYIGQFVTIPIYRVKGGAVQFKVLQPALERLCFLDTKDTDNASQNASSTGRENIATASGSPNVDLPSDKTAEAVLENLFAEFCTMRRFAQRHYLPAPDPDISVKDAAHIGSKIPHEIRQLCDPSTFKRFVGGHSHPDSFEINQIHDYELVNNACLRLGVTRKYLQIRVKSDGQCLFYSLSNYCFGSSSHGLLLRLLINAVCYKEYEHFYESPLSSLVNPSKHESIFRMLSSLASPVFQQDDAYRNYCGKLALFAASHLIGKSILVVNSEGNVNVDEYAWDENVVETGPILMLNKQHYTLLVTEEDDGTPIESTFRHVFIRPPKQPMATDIAGVTVALNLFTITEPAAAIASSTLTAPSRQQHFQHPAQTGTKPGHYSSGAIYTTPPIEKAKTDNFDASAIYQNAVKGGIQVPPGNTPYMMKDGQDILSVCNEIAMKRGGISSVAHVTVLYTPYCYLDLLKDRKMFTRGKSFVHQIQPGLNVVKEGGLTTNYTFSPVEKNGLMRRNLGGRPDDVLQSLIAKLDTIPEDEYAHISFFYECSNANLPSILTTIYTPLEPLESPVTFHFGITGTVFPLKCAKYSAGLIIYNYGPSPIEVFHIPCKEALKIVAAVANKGNGVDFCNLFCSGETRIVLGEGYMNSLGIQYNRVRLHPQGLLMTATASVVQIISLGLAHFQTKPVAGASYLHMANGDQRSLLQHECRDSNYKAKVEEVLKQSQIDYLRENPYAGIPLPQDSEVMPRGVGNADKRLFCIFENCRVKLTSSAEFTSHIRSCEFAPKTRTPSRPN